MNIAGSEFAVCKAGFCALHGINKSRVERLAQHKRNNITPPADRRGKHTSRPNKLPVDTVGKVIQHIKSFPVRSSHYSRQSTKKKYLNPDLNVNKMYHLYLEKHEPEAFLALKNKTASIKPSVSYEFYLRTFNTNFNYSFGYPRSDTCEVCDTLKLKLENETDQDKVRALEAEKLLHLRKAQHFYDVLKDVTQEAKNDPTIEGLCFDYQQNLPVPVLTTGELFYLRQVWVYNIGFYSCKTGCSKMYMFDETTGRKGSNETVSLLKHYIDNYITEEVKTLHLFSDNCAGQNKNILMVQFLSSLCASGKFIKIHHFPERGHSFMPCDRAFAQIEKVKRRKEYVYVPEQWYDIVSSASKNFSVVRVQQEMLLDFKRTLQPFFKRVIRNTTDSFRISRYRKFIYEGRELSVSPEQNSLFFSKFCLFKSVHIQPNINATRLYDSALPLDSKKYDDVMNIVQKYVPPVHMEYYKQLTSNRLNELQGTDSEASFSD